jgi:hypothetical protein
MPVTEIWLDNGMNLSGFWRKPSEFLMMEAMPYALGGLDATAGNPAPSFQNRGGAWSVRLAVKSGARTVKVDVRQPDVAAARPVLRVKANPDIGLAADMSATASAATDWQTVTLNFTATADGGVRVELENPDPEKPCWFDNLVLT